jgi:hypothetical protein
MLWGTALASQRQVSSCASGHRECLCTGVQVAVRRTLYEFVSVWQVVSTHGGHVCRVD